MTNTNWQSYGGETTISYFTQMVGLTVQNFVSAAVGMAIAVAFIDTHITESPDCAGKRPSPESLLQMMQEKERAKLRVYIGAAAGARQNLADARRCAPAQKTGH